MRVAFVHQAELRLEGGADPRGPGGDEMTSRVVFVAEAEDEHEVRSRIVEGLRCGRVEGAPRSSAWTVLRESA